MQVHCSITFNYIILISFCKKLVDMEKSVVNSLRNHVLYFNAAEIQFSFIDIFPSYLLFEPPFTIFI
jgi:hypothetical protein